MMKTRFLMLAMMMCMTALTFSACSDDDGDDKSIDVPEAVTQALKQKYPNATDVDWKQKTRILWPIAGWTEKIPIYGLMPMETGG